LISSVLICSTNDAFGIEGAPEGAENEPLWDDWSEEVGRGREGDTRMCDEVASRLTGICREGDENVGWSEDEPSPLSVPCAFSKSGLPIGIQIVGRHNADLSVLQMGFAFEQATNIGSQRPTIVK